MLLHQHASRCTRQPVGCGCPCAVVRRGARCAPGDGARPAAYRDHPEVFCALMFHVQTMICSHCHLIDGPFLLNASWVDRFPLWFSEGLVSGSRAASTMLQARALFGGRGRRGSLVGAFQSGWDALRPDPPREERRPPQSRRRQAVAIEQRRRGQCHQYDRDGRYPAASDGRQGRLRDRGRKVARHAGTTTAAAAAARGLAVEAVSQQVHKLSVLCKLLWDDEVRARGRGTPASVHAEAAASSADLANNMVYHTKATNCESSKRQCPSCCRWHRLEESGRPPPAAGSSTLPPSRQSTLPTAAGGGGAGSSYMHK